MTTPLISIVIPVFNGANYLRQAIDSALAQKYPHFEVLVVDDGSSDDGATAAIIHSYGDRIHALHKTNGGVSSALNLGIREAQGEYISWLSHDDLYLPNKLSRQVQALAKLPPGWLVTSGFQIIAEDGRLIRAWPDNKTREIRDGRGVIEANLFGCALLLPRELLLEVGLFNEANRSTQDYEMWLELVHRDHPIHWIPEVLCAWRDHGESDTRARHDLVEQDSAWLFDRMLARYPIDFFCPPEANEPSARHSARLQAWLAHEARKRGAWNYARRMVWQSLSKWPRPTRFHVSNLREMAILFKKRFIARPLLG